MAPMSTIKTVCVYCGSGPGTNPRFTEGAKAFGKALAENNIRLVYGGGPPGLMGSVATSVLDHRGTLTRIIPHLPRVRGKPPTRGQGGNVPPPKHPAQR